MPRLLFVKTSSLGDVVHHCPAVSDAAAKFPGAEIDWVVEEAFVGVAAMHRAVRRVIPVALRRWRRSPWRRRSWAELAAFRRALAREDYDAVIDAQGLLKSAMFACWARGTRHGLDARSAREPLAALCYHVRHRVPRGRHAVERNRALVAAALGYRVTGPCDYGLQVRGTGKADPASPVVFLTMTSRADKLWPEASWIELGRALARPVLLPWGSEAEKARAQRIAAGLEGATVLPPRTLAELAALFSGSSGVVGLDTGLTHLAAAAGAPTVGLYCGSDPALTGLYGAARARNVGGPGRAPSVDEVREAFEAIT